MTALAIQADVPEKASSFAMRHNRGVAASVNVFKGALMAVDANGDFAPGTATTGLTPVGRAEQNQDNSSGGAGDLNVAVRSGIFRFQNDGGTAVVAGDVGDVCFILDDATVSGDGTARSPAGIVYEVDADGVWVAVGFPLNNNIA